MAIIDIDDPETWPEGLRDFVEGRADALRGSTAYTPDLRLEEADCREIHALVRGYRVKAYHATRLLDAEAQAIREQGLRRLSHALVDERLRFARADTALSEEQFRHLMENNVFAKGFQVKSRAGRVCLILSRMSLDESPDGLWRLLAQWGGEGIYWVSGEEFETQLTTIGHPSIVVAGLDLGDPDSPHLIFPGLLAAFLGTSLNLQSRGAEVHYFADVSPADILDIWQPGNAEYDRHVELRRV